MTGVQTCALPILKESGDKIDAATKEPVQQALEEAKKSLDSKDADELKRVTEKLTAASNKMAEVLYKASAGAAEAGNSNGAGQSADGAETASQKKSGKDDDVIDADYKEV